MNAGFYKTEVIPIAPDEKERERALRERFAAFWSAANGNLRIAYDSFISGSPIAAGVTIDAVDDHAAHGFFFRPQQASATNEAILFLHGGGYVLGSAKAYRGFVSQIVSRANVPALVIDYPLAPEASLPAAPEAAKSAWRYLVSRGFDRIAIVGDSAGGGLSLVTLASLAKSPSGPAPVGGVVFSPWTDLSFSGASMTDAAVIDPLISLDYLRDCAAKYVGNFATDHPMASPLYGDLKGLPPLLIQVGTDERLLDDSRQYAKRASQAGVSVELQIFEGMHHVFQLDVAHLATSRNALNNAARFLRTVFDHR
ncbi:alpha/beta hydrolase [Bradyrhizobium sp. NBAIM08]|uniref:alpha/beta hydrolase n=1 Tax=Bradyrhizobium sp. NBAIM08 TaxID=2793815 RepID=UPI001CD35EC2|nr:alpha/beta hydrolase [Bradyrhizobium sp. NBAIM08]MCA1474218.1 alpha/beta hydrolase [Bradyrhizobium sp. NBAIM08]